MTSRSEPERRSLERRTFLRLAGATGAAVALDQIVAHNDVLARKRPTLQWSNPRTWGGNVPGPNDIAVIKKRIRLDVNATVKGVRIEQGGVLIFHPEKRISLEATGNVVVHGKLVMRPSAPKFVHRLTFVGVDEAAYQGGGFEVLESDVGLWVMHSGSVDLMGSSKVPWLRAAGAIGQGARTITLTGKPTGWRRGDEIAITPTIGPNAQASSTAYDYAKIESVDGNNITLSRATTHAHPSVNIGRDKIMTAEVLNLTRNVRIGGTPQGRAHFMIHAVHRPSHIQHVAVRHVGPRQGQTNDTHGVLGRYGVHFHVCKDGSRNSLVRGVVVRDAGNHAFVAHESHDIDFKGCISHNTFGTAYWWDGPVVNHGPRPPTRSALFKRCVASLVQEDPPHRGFRLAGFSLGKGRNNVAIGCVAVGIQGNKDAAGYIWPEGAGSVWKFEDCVAHNNRINGIFTWQNTTHRHVIDRYVGYHNGKTGISHGAYQNGYRYQNSILYGNGKTAIEIHSVSKSQIRQGFVNILCDGAGLTDNVITVEKHQLPGNVTDIIGCEFKGYNVAAIGFNYDGRNGESEPERFEIVDCRYHGNEFWLDDNIVAESAIKVQDAVHGAILLRRRDQPGELRPEWNARVTRIDPFA